MLRAEHRRAWEARCKWTLQTDAAKENETPRKALATDGSGQVKIKEEL
jgi:hypothetical protein